MSDETKARIAEIEARARRTIAGCCDVDATGCDDREHLDARTDLWWRSVLTAETRRADEAERERDERTESMEWWRTACVRWQDWGKALLAELGQQLRHGLYGSTPTREIIASLARAAPPVPHCLRCGHFSTRHEVDDEELRECLDCQCSQYEACT